jgi:hypothetical protein
VWGLVKDGNSTIGGRTAFPVFRACGGLLLVHWFWGMSVYIWNRYRINYIFLFDFDPRIVSPAIDIFEDATAETLVFLIIMLLYYKVRYYLKVIENEQRLFHPFCIFSYRLEQAQYLMLSHQVPTLLFLWYIP